MARSNTLDQDARKLIAAAKQSQLAEAARLHHFNTERWRNTAFLDAVEGVVIGLDKKVMVEPVARICRRVVWCVTKLVKASKGISIWTGSWDELTSRDPDLQLAMKVFAQAEARNRSAALAILTARPTVIRHIYALASVLRLRERKQSSTTLQETPPRLEFIPGAIRWKEKQVDLSGKPRALLEYIHNTRFKRATARELKDAIWQDDMTNDEAVKVTVSSARTALKKLFGADEDPLGCIDKGPSLSWELRLPVR